MDEKLFSDDPIGQSNEDKLGREPFAKQVVGVCQNVAKESASSVVALVGPWGSGKSSVLELMKQELVRSKWSVAEFNPWLLSDLESLMTTFFNEIIEAIPEDTKTSKELRKRIGGYAKTISPLGKLGSLVGVDVSEIIKKAGALLEGDQSLSKQRKELVEQLKKHKKPILVVLDDLDRLHPDELLMVFKLVRLVGRLPNLHYLLSYDEETLLDVISETDLAKDDKIRARSYLEKIVQVKLDLPHMNDQQRLKLVNLSLDEVLRRNSITLSDDDQTRLGEAYRDSLSLYLSQPRAIRRYFAQVEALYPLVKGEVNFTDFALLTFLRTFEPNVYRLIIDYRIELTGQGFMTPDHDEKNEAKKARWLQLIEDQNVKHAGEIFDLLAILFIPIRSAKNNTAYSNGFYKDEHIQKRVGNKDYFDRYFVFGVPDGDIADTDLLTAVKLLESDEKSASAQLAEFLKKDASLTLRKLKDLQEREGLPKEIIGFLAVQYSGLPNAEGFLALPPQWAVWDIIKKFFDQMNARQRLDMFNSAVKKSSGLLMLLHTFSTSEQKEEDKPLSKSLQEILKKRLAEVMTTIAKKKFDNITQNDIDFLYPYRSIFGETELTEWLWRRVDEQKWEPVSLLARLVPEAISYGDRGTHKRISDLSNDTLEYFGLDRLLSHAEDEIKKVTIKENYSYRDEPPTFANKKSYVLRLLKNRYDNKNSESS